MGNDSIVETSLKGFVKLGSDAPAIKYKKLTGTMPSTQGGSVYIDHGLSSHTILSMVIKVEAIPGYGFYHDSKAVDGFEFGFYQREYNIRIKNSDTNSASIRNKPFTVLITYEE